MNRVLNRRYEILDKIGEGGMAITYGARDRLLAREVAVKVMREQFLSDDEFVERFRREAQSVAKLNHPNVAAVYDIGQDGNCLYMVMELVRGVNLKQYVKQRGFLSEKQAARIARQVALALAQAHKEGLVHRDIKPHNILLDSEEQVKVTDFGIARALASESLTKTHAIVGTAQYLSPEQARGEPAVPASDLYSLGVVLYEMVTGRLPFTGESPVAVALKHAEEEPPSPAQFNPGLSEDMETVLYRALQKRIEDRYTSALDFAADLECIEQANPLDQSEERTVVISREKITGARKSPDETVEKTLIRPPSVGTLSGHDNEMEKTPPVVPKGRTSAAGGWVLAILLCLIAAAVGMFLAEQGKPRLVSVPYLVGKSQTEARFILEERKLVLGDLKFDNSETVPYGSVMAQDPVHNELVEEGTRVNLVISKGPRLDLTTIPDVRNLSLSDAERRLLSAGLNVGQRTAEFSDAVPKGYVIRQSPAPGTKIEKTASVAVVISKGREESPPPSGHPVEGIVEYTIPDGPQEMTFKIVTIDDSGEHDLFSKTVKPGDKISEKVIGEGVTIVRCYLQDELVKEIKLEPKPPTT